ncbi:MAG: UDP-glucose/GDP-mannose dehydrogenase family protein [Fibrobacterota bacterium]|nr:UDP-glucose/GDP-mannose dehydrogenase family protein [Fibrobacterota bacterium]QQS05301.1 MAG: UDP-glucose/GDP-mannose dehydrogenase family protein [Fibrobacterota bacterium]
MEIAVIGTGYVGLVAGACFAESGNSVVCVDLDPAKVKSLSEGIATIYEPGLEEMLRRNLHAGRISFTTSTPEAVAASQVVFIAVGTPQGEDGSADLTYVLAAAKQIGQAMNGPKIVVDKSTVPVGTAERVAAEIRAVTTHKVAVVSNPEFLKEGNALDDFLKPDRVVIGTDDLEARQVMEDLYSPFVRTGKPILFMDPRSAELAKYAANTLLATKISFMNEIANLCEAVGADVGKVREGIGTDVRIGPHFLFPGPGYGGSCFPKDVSALGKIASDAGFDFKILQAVTSVNERQRRVVLRKVESEFGADLTGKTFAVWGLAFKPKTDDMRESPSLTVIRGLLERGAKVVAHDPEAIKEGKRIFGDSIGFTESNYEACTDADALLILTEWSTYQRPNFETIKRLLRNPLIIDARNIYTPERMKQMGFTYHSIGRATVRP